MLDLSGILMQQEFLDNLGVVEPIPNQKVSVIIPTYNRSPNPVKEDNNPLAWSLESTLNQKLGGLDEIIVIDDGSNDYTLDVVDHFRENSEVDIRYIRNEKRSGLAVSRNKGVLASRNDLLLFTDDDCIFGKYILFGGKFTFNLCDNTVAALQFPVYHRTTVPKVGPKDLIAKVDLDSGIIEGNYDVFPQEYFDVNSDIFLDSDTAILRPIRIRNLGGVFLGKKNAILDVGGFPIFGGWQNDYRIETELALKLQENGNSLLFTPDPKFHFVHLKYGAPENLPLDDRAYSPLGRLVNEANVQRTNTGCRVDAEQWFFDRIVSTYVVIGKRDLDAAKGYLEKMRKEFVEENKLFISGVGTKIAERKHREEIFRKIEYSSQQILMEAV